MSSNRPVGNGDVWVLGRAPATTSENGGGGVIRSARRSGLAPVVPRTTGIMCDIERFFHLRSNKIFIHFSYV